MPMLTRCAFHRRQRAFAHASVLTRSYRTKVSKNKKTLAKEAIQDIESASQASSLANEWTRPATITHGSDHHQDLASFLAHAKKQGLSKTSTTYQGTLYEYTAAVALNRLGFDVCRTGKTADQGIDLLGWWRLPSASPDEPPIKVLIQCKAFTAKLGPRFVRELEGSFAGAPAHWQGEGVMGFLVAPSEATKGMREALISSNLPLGFLQITRDSRILQMLWNDRASFWHLSGHGVTTKYGKDGEQEIALTWNGRIVEKTMKNTTKVC